MVAERIQSEEPVERGESERLERSLAVERPDGVVEADQRLVARRIELRENRIVVVVETEAANVGQGRDPDDGGEERTVEPRARYRDPLRGLRTSERRGVRCAACDYLQLVLPASETECMVRL